MYMVMCNVNINVQCECSNDIDGLMEEYVEKTAEDACEADLPMLFISFPSAKDPTFNQRYPG
jgi:all-trans-retinol 13,14-reductase